MKIINNRQYLNILGEKHHFWLKNNDVTLWKDDVIPVSFGTGDDVTPVSFGTGYNK